MNPNYIPNSDTDANAWLTNFSLRLVASPVDYGVLPGTATLVVAATDAYRAALVLSTAPTTRTSVTVAAKDAAKASALAIVRPVAVRISMSATIANALKESIGVTIRSASPTPIPAPVIAPVIQFLSATPLRQQLQVRQPGSTSKSKPFGAIGIEIARSVGTVSATDPAQLSIIGTYGKTPLTQEFSAAARGNIVTYAARYVTRSGPRGVAQKGPWSALVSFTVI